MALCVTRNQCKYTTSKDNEKGVKTEWSLHDEYENVHDEAEYRVHRIKCKEHVLLILFELQVTNW